MEEHPEMVAPTSVKNRDGQSRTSNSVHELNKNDATTKRLHCTVLAISLFVKQQCNH